MMSIFVRTLMLTAVVTLNPTFARAECTDASAAQRQAGASACYAHCNRVFHREEENQACHQECHAQYQACQTNAGSS